MKPYPAIALLEISSIAQGVLTGDAMANNCTCDWDTMLVGTGNQGHRRSDGVLQCALWVDIVL